MHRTEEKKKRKRGWEAKTGSGLFLWSKKNLTPFCVPYESGGNPSEAIAAYEQAARIDPLDFIPRYKLSSAYARAGRDADARRELEAMQENRARYDQLHELQNQAMEKTEDADLRYRIGEAAAALGRQELAQAWYRAALGLDPTHAAAQARLSQAGGSSMPGNAAKPAPSAAAPLP